MTVIEFNWLNLLSKHANIREMTCKLCRVKVSTHQVIIWSHLIHVYFKCAGFTFRQQSRQNNSCTLYAHPFLQPIYTPLARWWGGEKKEEVRISGTESLRPSDNKNRAREYMTLRNTLKDLSCLSESLENISSG